MNLSFLALKQKTKKFQKKIFKPLGNLSIYSLEGGLVLIRHEAEEWAPVQGAWLTEE